jgi:hypothetical protein
MHYTNRITTARYLYANRKNVKHAVEAIAGIDYRLSPTGTDCLRSSNYNGGQNGRVGGSGKGAENEENIPIPLENSAFEHVAQLVEQRTFNP